MFNYVGLFWQKKFISFASSYIIELDGDQLAFLYGGNAMADCKMKVGRTNSDAWNRFSVERGAGQLVANAMIAGYTKTFEANVALYNEGQRDQLLQHPKSELFQLSEISDVKIIEKTGMMDPMPARGLHNLMFSAKGKRWRIALRYINREEAESFMDMLRGVVTA